MHNIVVRGVGLQYDELLEGYTDSWSEVAKLFLQGIQYGTVRPLENILFSKDQVQDALRVTQSNNKVVVEVNYM